MVDNKTLQWASLLLPTVIAIVMAIMTFSNRSTTMSATTLEKVVQVEQEIEDLKDELKKLDKEKVDQQVFNMLLDKIEDLSEQIDELPVKSN
jgi:peptidoglycan hydrolase CwlO-like protein